MSGGGKSLKAQLESYNLKQAVEEGRAAAQAAAKAAAAVEAAAEAVDGQSPPVVVAWGAGQVGQGAGEGVELSAATRKSAMKRPLLQADPHPDPT